MKYKLVNQNTNEKGGLVGNMKEKNKMKQRKILQGSRGITLIALVITIIVLLILAGVSIIALTSQGNILERASSAREKNNIEALKESINVVMLGRKISKETGKEIKSLKEDLETIEGVEVEEVKEDTCYVTRDGYTVTVYEEGDIEIGKVSVWDGETSEVPEINEFNWYIYNGAQMKFFADFVNNGNSLTEEQRTLVQKKGYSESDVTITANTTVYLMEDIDLGARQTNGELKSGTNWTPIGITKPYFIGTFDGNNHIIKGLYINRTENFSGLFADSTNTIKNVTLKDGYVKGGNCMGGLVGLGYIVENCHNVNTTVTSMEGNYYTIGGLVGQIEISIKDCTNSGTVIANGLSSSGGQSRAGGIVGQNVDGSVISNCKNIGNVTAKGAWVGGIVGYGKSTIERCNNIGIVSGNELVGGIAGRCNTVTFNDCLNSGDVFGACYVSGIIGAQYSPYKLTASRCENRGNIFATDSKTDYCYAAGICSSFGDKDLGGLIENCKNYGDVSCKSAARWNRAGGLVAGLTEPAEIRDSSNFGNVSATGESTYMVTAGGIFADTFPESLGLTIQNCYNSGDILGKNANYIYIGGIGGRIQGFPHSLTINCCYSKGKVQSEEVKTLLRRGGIIGAGSTTTAEGITQCYYFDALNDDIGGMTGTDFVENKLMETDQIFNNFEEFNDWVIEQ